MFYLFSMSNKSIILSHYVKEKYRSHTNNKESIVELSNNQKSNVVPYRFNVFHYLFFLFKNNISLIKNMIYKRLLGNSMIWEQYSRFLLWSAAGIFLYMTFVLSFLNVIAFSISMVLVISLFILIIIKQLAFFRDESNRNKLMENIEFYHNMYIGTLISNIDIRYQSMLDMDSEKQVTILSDKILQQFKSKIYDIFTLLIPFISSLLFLTVVVLVSSNFNSLKILQDVNKKYIINKVNASSLDYIEYYVKEIPAIFLLTLWEKIGLLASILYTLSILHIIFNISITGLFILLFNEEENHKNLEQSTAKQFDLILNEFHNMKDCDIINPVFRKLKADAMIQTRKANQIEYISIFILCSLCGLFSLMIWLLYRYYMKNSTFNSFEYSDKYKEALEYKNKTNLLSICLSALKMSVGMSFNVNIDKFNFGGAVNVISYIEAYCNRALLTILILGAIIILLLQVLHIQSIKETVKNIIDLKKIVFNVGYKTSVENILNIKFRDANIYHNMQLGPTLSHVNLDISAGKVYILVGPSGAGKSTFINCIGGRKFVNPENAMQCFDGSRLVLYESLNVKDIKQLIGYVEQNAPLPGNPTISDLFKFDDVTIPKAEMKQIMRTVCMDDWLNLGNDLYKTKLGDMGSSLSGGQRRRVALGMLLSRKKLINIIDEALDSLDNKVLTTIVHNIVCDLILPPNIRNDFYESHSRNENKFIEENILQRKIFLLITHRPMEIIDAIKLYFKMNNIPMSYIDKYYSVLLFQNNTIEEVLLSDYKEQR